MKIKTVHGDTITPRRMAAAVIDEAILNCYNFAERIDEAGDVEVDWETVNEVVAEIQKIVEPIHKRLSHIRRTVGSGYIEPGIAENPVGVTIYERPADAKGNEFEDWKLHRYVEGKARPEVK